MLAPQKARHEKFEQTPKFEQVVLNGSTGETEAHPGLDLAYGTGRDGVRIFDVLGFVKDDGVELVLFQLVHIAAQQGVGGDDKV